MNSVQTIFCALAVWDLFTVGRGTDRKKINLKQEPVVKKEGGAKTDRESGVENKSRETVQSDPGRVPGFPPVILCLHTVKFRTISQLPFQWPLKRDRFLPGYSPSIQWEWLLSWENPNLWHPQWVTSLRCVIASVQTAAPRNACEICVCVRFRAHCWD